MQFILAHASGFGKRLRLCKNSAYSSAPFIIEAMRFTVTAAWLWHGLRRDPSPSERCMKTLSLAFGLMLALATVASAAPFTGFNDAGFKIRGNMNSQYNSYRSYAAPMAAPVGRQSFSYAPGSNAAPAPMPANGYRSYSYGGGNGCCCR
jgi:hypothetical protein